MSIFMQDESNIYQVSMMFIKNDNFSDLKMAIIEEVGDSGETNYLQVNLLLKFKEISGG